MSELLRAALEYLDLGFSIIPVRIDCKTGRKPALVGWKEFQSSPPSLEKVREWFLRADFPALRHYHNKLGIGIITGRVSRNLAVIDFDSKEVMAETLSELMSVNPKLYEKITNTWVVETGKGYHYYLKVRDPDLSLFTNRIGIRKGVDIRAEGGYVVAPPSPHPTGKTYTFRHKPEMIAELSWDEYLTLLTFLEGDKEAEERETSFSDSKILEIVNLLKTIYRQGFRNYIILFLTGWLKKAGIKYETAKKIVELLAENDEEKDLRIYVLDRTYGLRGNPPSEKDLKGKTGLQEIAEKLLGEEKALELIRRLEERLGKASPFQDSTFSLIDFSRKLYYVANPRKGIIARAHEDSKNGGIVYRELIAECCPVRVTVYEDPLGGVRKFEIEFKGLLNKTIGPADLETIAARLKAEGVVKHKRLIEDALSSLVVAFIRNGKAEIRRELEKPGFYYIEGRIKAVKWQTEEYTVDDLKRALLLLKELREKWYAHLGERFTTIIKWSIIAPFSYAIKQIRGTHGIHLPWLLLHGSASTGKSTLGRIARAIWNLPANEKGGSHIDTVPRFGKVVSESTFPVLINEVAEVLAKDSVKEVIKSAIETLFARGKYVQGVYVEEPALAPMIFTTNKTYPADDALLRRFVAILFSISDRISEDKAQQFENEILPKLHDLKFLGYFVFQRIAENPELLKGDWGELSTSLLREVFELTGLEVPDWIDEKCRGESLEEITELINEEIRARLLEDINQRYSRHISKVTVNIEDYDTSLNDLKWRFEALLQEGFIPWAFRRGEDVIITNSVLKLLDGLAVDSLKSLADRFGWTWKNAKVNGRVLKTVRVSIEDFVAFLSGDYASKESEPSISYEEWHIHPGGDEP